MELFSHRKGITPVKKIIQVESIDDDLRNKLWNALTIIYWNKAGTKRPSWISYIPRIYPNYNIVILLNNLWHDYYKRPVDTMDDYWPQTYKYIRESFFKCEWYEVYNFIEFIVNNYSNKNDSENLKFMGLCNSILMEESSAYRFVGGKIVQITSENEIAEIEEALHASISPVQQHINRALELLSDKKSPDYRNSIKESISAVEAICKLIANNKNATLTLAIETIKKGKKMKIHPMHPDLGIAFSKLYGYTNKSDGIRHALMDEPNLDFEDAKFMLVSCSAFINYLIVKSSKAGVQIKL